MIQIMATPHTSFTMLKIYKVLTSYGKLDSSSIVDEIGDTRQVIYKSLNALAERGWLKKEQEKGSREELGRAQRNYFQLTKEGSKELEIAANELRKWVCE